MIKFFHTADLHLGVENYGRMDPDSGIHSRLIDFSNAFNSCIDDAISQDIDFFLFCGDAYKTAYPSPTQQRMLMKAFFRLYKANIPVVIVVGNHDHPLSFGKANALDVFAEFPLDGFHVISKPQLFTLDTKSGPVQIIGIPWPTRNNMIAKDEHRHKNSTEITSYISEKVSDIIEHLASQVDSNIPAVFAGHLTVSNGVFSGSEKRAIFGTDPLFLPSLLAQPVFDYVALGHLHRYQNLNPKGQPAVVYSGSIERVDFGERKETKGYCSILLNPAAEAGKRCEYEFIPVKNRPFVQIEVELEEGIDFTNQILDAIKKHQITDSIIKIIYHLPDGKLNKVDLNAVHRACSDAAYVAAVVPVQKVIQRDRRLSLKVDMDILSLLEKYLETKEDLKKNKLSLLEKAKNLHSQINSDLS